MTLGVVGVGFVGQVPDCAVGVLCWPMGSEIFVGLLSMEKRLPLPQTSEISWHGIQSFYGQRCTEPMNTSKLYLNDLSLSLHNVSCTV